MEVYGSWAAGWSLGVSWPRRRAAGSDFFWISHLAVSLGGLWKGSSRVFQPGGATGLTPGWPV